jgi:hypothetical protein
MTPADWADFVCRLTTMCDDQYVLGNFADQGDLLDYVLSILPGAEHMCKMQVKTTTSFSCECRGVWMKENTVSEQGITIQVDSDEPLLHHILKAFSPEHVSDNYCERCLARSTLERPAQVKRLLCSLARFLRINITAPLNSAAQPLNFHQHGLQDYDSLNLSQLNSNFQQAQTHYTLREAIMYRERHHWVYLHSQFPIFISDEVSRLASPEDRKMVALCARILLYEQTSSPDSSPLDLVSRSNKKLVRKEKFTTPVLSASAKSSQSSGRSEGGGIQQYMTKEQHL